MHCFIQEPEAGQQVSSSSCYWCRIKAYMWLRPLWVNVSEIHITIAVLKLS